ncbi:MFS transporter [Actinoplanes philippinensis]|uniref:MFS transporter n=1 Tax=Actinoplanes philippinensis TaxID=35752 RepID=UPI0033E0CB04
MRAALTDRRPLAVPAFRRWWAASLVTAVGGSFSVVAVPAQLYAKTGSSAALGGSAVLSFAGLVIGALTAGTLADRWDRRVVLLAAQSGLAMTYAALWAHATLDGPLPILLALVTCQGLTFGAISTTVGAVLPRLLPPDLLAAGNSLNSLVRYGGWILGPLLGGLLIPHAGLNTLYLCDALALLAVLWAVHRLPAMPPASSSHPDQGGDGLRPPAPPANHPARDGESLRLSGPPEGHSAGDGDGLRLLVPPENRSAGDGDGPRRPAPPENHSAWDGDSLRLSGPPENHSARDGGGFQLASVGEGRSDGDGLPFPPAPERPSTRDGGRLPLPPASEGRSARDGGGLPLPPASEGRSARDSGGLWHPPARGGGGPPLPLAPGSSLSREGDGLRPPSASEGRSGREGGGSRVSSVPGNRSVRDGGGLLDGLRHLRRSRLLMAVLAVDLAAMVLGMPVVLFPELARDTYGDPAGGGPVLGLFYAAYPAGVIAAGLLSGTFTRIRRSGRAMAAAAIAWGATVVLLGLTTRLWVALPALVLGGAVNFVLSTHRNAMTQAHTDDALRGRVQGLLTVVLTGGPQLANLLHGAGAWIGPRPAIIAGGLLTMIAVVVTVRAVPELITVAEPADPA